MNYLAKTNIEKSWKKKKGSVAIRMVNHLNLMINIARFRFTKRLILAEILIYKPIFSLE